MKGICKIIILVAGVFCYTSCGDFLSENASNQVYVETINDVNELILGEGYMSSGMPSYSNMFGVKTNAVGSWIHVMDDDLKVQVNSSNTKYNKWSNSLGSFHYWQQAPFIDYREPFTPFEDTGWARMYKHINAMNVIVFELDRSFKGEKMYSKYKGEALFLRALYYYYLVNIYAVPYDIDKSTSDLGVPIKLSETVDDKNYSRNSVAEVYDVIVEDLKSAIILLEGVKQTSIYRPNQTAARILLSRVYLYMSRWSDCVTQCDEILKDHNYALLDYNTIPEKGNLISAKSPETIFSNGDYRILAIVRSSSIDTGGSNSSTGNSSVFRVADDLINLIDKDNDARFKGFEYAKNTTYPSGRGGYFPTYKFWKNTDGDLSDCCTFRLPEVYLNKAEALVMQGAAKEGDAKIALNDLRAKRFKSDYAYAITSAGNALVKEIRDERRRELCFEGHRWFDLRRYAVNKVFPFEKELKHEYDDGPDGSADGYPDGYYVLPKYSECVKGGNWVMAIPDKEIQINEGALVDNPRTDIKQVVGGIIN